LFSGDRTDSNGLTTVLYLDTTEVEININRIYQDSYEHSLSKSFSYPQNFIGPMSITISCEGKTSNILNSGTIQILSSSTINPITIPVLDKNSTPLPCNPGQIGYYGDLSGVRSDYVETAAYSINGSTTLNVTLSFDTNSFGALSRYLEVKINNTIIATTSFSKVPFVIVSFSIPLEQGTNIIRFYFCVNLGVDEIWFTNIALFGKLQLLEDEIPEESFDWFSCNGPSVNHSFNLSSLKPFSNINEQNLLILLFYDYIGSAILPILNCQILSDSDIIYSGTIHFSYPEIIIDTYTVNYSSNLALRVYGTATGEGVFYLLNTCTIEIEPVPILDENSTLEKNVVSSKTYETPTFGDLPVKFIDVFYFDSPSATFNLSFSLNLYNEFYSPVDRFILRIKINNNQVFYQSLNDKQTLNDKVIIEINQGYQEIEIILSIYGEGLVVTIENLSYILTAALEEVAAPTNPFELPNPSSDSKPFKPSVTTLMSISLLLDAIALFILIRHLDKKNKRTNRNAQVKLDEEEYELLFNGGYVKTERFFNFSILGNMRKVLLVSTTVFVILKNVGFLLILRRIVSIASSENTEFEFVILGKISFNVFTTVLFASTFFWFSVVVNSSTNTFYKDLHSKNKFLFRYVKYVFFISGWFLFSYLKKNYAGKLFPWSITISGLFFILFIGYMRFGKQKKEQSEPSLAEFFTNQGVVLRKIKQSKLLENHRKEVKITVEKDTINNIKKQDEELFCYFCDALLEKVEDGGPLICLNCGKKTRKCEICMKYMVAKEELVQIIDCGHVFHKDHLMEWIRVKKICPICKEKINDNFASLPY
ncbi:MAG: E3 ubiquitin protein ligase, partial [Candidatus Heimdallarchaeota archaeon]|nr:E3 ubiquitin protein ligase [Candidatus Heimdallarchaeota archaeon]MCK4609986.1 E3 ubiquitin protein ligase [Candidatus Heimdallarchaeota archaeon]